MPAKTKNLIDQRTQFAKAIIEFAVDDARRFPATPNPIKPNHYIPWKWPLHPISADYRLSASEWKSSEVVQIAGVDYAVLVATTDFGVFGRCEALRCEAMGKDLATMIANVAKTAKPLLARRKLVGEILRLDGPFTGSIRDLSTLDHLKLFYATDRAIAHDAQAQIETGPNHKLVFDACIEILNDRDHPNRRTAQWLVLDLFEDLPSVASTAQDETVAIDAIYNLIASSTDDFARTIFKAGVVLGGHICTHYCAERLIQLTTAPEKIARRSAVHACFHLVEWLPESKDSVVKAVQYVAESDPEQLLRTFAASVVRDILADEIDHMIEPKFDNED